MKSPTAVDRFVIKVNEDPKSLSGISNDTGLPGSNVTASSVVVACLGNGLGLGVSISHENPRDAGG